MHTGYFDHLNPLYYIFIPLFLLLSLGILFKILLLEVMVLELKAGALSLQPKLQHSHTPNSNA
jgi:hypothetical protein